MIETKGLVQIQDESILEDIAQKVIQSNPDQVSAYLNGKDKLFGFFVGQIMKETQGKANPKSVNNILRRLLKYIYKTNMLKVSATKAGFSIPFISIVTSVFARY